MSDVRIQPNSPINLRESRNEQIQEKKLDTAMEFERIFSKHLVEELTKNSFKMGDTFGSGSFKVYRDHITDTLANELAEQRKLGMADMLIKHWDIEDDNQ